MSYWNGVKAGALPVTAPVCISEFGYADSYTMEAPEQLLDNLP